MNQTAVSVFTHLGTSRSVADEWRDYASAYEIFVEQRATLDSLLLTYQTEPLQSFCDRLYVFQQSPMRRVSFLRDFEKERASYWLSAADKAKASRDSTAYTLACAGAYLYLPLYAIRDFQVELVQPWLIVHLGPLLACGAVAGMDEDESLTQESYDWCVNLAHNVLKAKNDNTLLGEDHGWRTWIHTLGHCSPAVPFYPSTINLKPFVEVYGRIRAMAYTNHPPTPDTAFYNIIGVIQPKPDAAKKTRIGLFCNRPYGHAHGLPDIAWWLAALDKAVFEPILIIHYTPHTKDHLSEFLLKHGETILKYAPIVIVGDASLNELKKLDLDILYNFAGLCWSANDRIAHVSVARHHITSFYTAATTGGTSIGHYLTSPDLDPRHAESFVEQPLLIHGLPFGFHYQSYFSGLPTETARDPSWPANAVVYSIGVAVLTKMKPAFMVALLDILRRVPNSILVLMASAPLAHRPYLSEYMTRKCQDYNIDPSRIRIYPHATRVDYYGMVGASDVFLDYFYFTGTNNVIDPISLKVPPVVLFTAEGHSRNRIGGIIMKQLGLDDLVTTDTDAYVDLAVRLGTDANYRASLKTRLGRELIKSAPFFDGQSFIRRVEKVLSNLSQIPSNHVSNDDAIEAKLDADFKDFSSNLKFS